MPTSARMVGVEGTLWWRRSGERLTVDWPFLCKNNWKKTIKKRSKGLKIM
jgi:hypothetical protein